MKHNLNAMPQLPKLLGLMTKEEMKAYIYDLTFYLCATIEELQQLKQTWIKSNRKEKAYIIHAIDEILGLSVTDNEGVGFEPTTTKEGET